MNDESAWAWGWGLLIFVLGAAYFNVDLNPFNNEQTVYYENKNCTQTFTCEISEKFVRITIVANPETQSIVYSLNDGAGPTRIDSNRCVVMNIDNWNCDGFLISKIDDSWVAISDDHKIMWGIHWAFRYFIE